MMKTPVVAHVVVGLQVGGLERVVVNLALGTRAHGYAPLVVCLDEPGELAAELTDSEVPVYALHKRPGRDWRTVLRLAALLRRERVSLIHTHNPMPHFHGTLAAMLAGVRARIHTKHGRNYPEDRGRVLQNRWLSMAASMIVPVSGDVNRVVLEIERVPPRKTRLILNGVDTNRYRPPPDKVELDGGPRRHSFTIGTVARLSPEKDQGMMLSAFALLLEKRADARLIFVGDGPSASELRAHAETLGIAAQVEFRGQRRDIPAQLGAFDLFTLSSQTEGLSMTILEAMASGLPVVATDVGGNRECVQPPECGLIVAPGDPKALAAAWLKVLVDAEAARRMGVASRHRAEAVFSLEQMTARYAHLYDEILGRGRKTERGTACIVSG